jgi:hypothetical protein
MSYFSRFAALPLLALASALCMTGCPWSQNQAAASSSQAGSQDQAVDPASGNMATADSNTSAPAPSNASNSGGSYSQAAYQAPSQNYDQGSDDPGYGAQPVEYADQPPPPLPEYDQPPTPGDDYLWTPGYWAWGDGGYYWVPGVWVEAPYEGALWTPGYWGYYHHRYGFYRGYWGPHIGYYGGVDYGFGYVGFGYQGGYWGGGHFNYNRSYNNVNVNIVHNVYDRPMRDEHRGGVRVSFNGGSGGLQVRARPAELAARHEEHAPPMRAQLQNEHVAGGNRAQFANVNHGRPASMAVNQPLQADHNVRMPAEVKARNQADAQHQQRQGQPMQAQHQGPLQQQQQPGMPQQQQHQMPGSRNSNARRPGCLSNSIKCPRCNSSIRCPPCSLSSSAKCLSNNSARRHRKSSRAKCLRRNRNSAKCLRCNSSAKCLSNNNSARLHRKSSVRQHHNRSVRLLRSNSVRPHHNHNGKLHRNRNAKLLRHSGKPLRLSRRSIRRSSILRRIQTGFRGHQDKRRSITPQSARG